jgi:prepilin-type N-terminal cleavage/methylation domain-containing protein
VNIGHVQQLCHGFTLTEVMVTMGITLTALMGSLSLFHVSEQLIGEARLANRALVMAESRIEAKQSTRWDRLLADDLFHNGHFTMMHDDGEGDDIRPSDGVYSNSVDHQGIHLSWTVTWSRPESLVASGLVLLEATASYSTRQGLRQIKVSAIRANPHFIGFQ